MTSLVSTFPNERESHLHQHRKWLTGLDVVQPVQVQSCTRVLQEGLRVGVDLAQLRTADARKHLTGRVAYDHVERVLGWPELESFGELLRRRRDITRSGVSFGPVLEVYPMGQRCVWLVLDRRCNVEAGSQKTERQAATPRKHIQDTRPLSSTKTLDLPCDR